MEAQSRKPPSWAVELLSQFGKSPTGLPRYRVIWSEDRIRYTCGAWRREYGEGRDRWMLESWCAPEVYGDRETWEGMREADGSSSLGPYPAQGDYEWSFTFEDENGTAVPLDPSLLSLLCQCIARNKLVSPAQRKAAIAARLQREKEERKARIANALDDAMQMPFGTNAVSGIPSKKTPDNIVIRDIKPSPALGEGAFSQTN